jgi:magnesium-transporting ATPase (P-type)
LLCFNATCAKTSSVFTVGNDNPWGGRRGSYGGLLVFALVYFEYAGNLKETAFENAKFVLLAVSVVFLALDIFYYKKIDILWQSYYKYYNKYLLYLFILIQAVCVCAIIYKVYEKI